MNLTDEQNRVIATDGHQLVIGGPGSGKTTISIFKATRVLQNLCAGQRVLFLSFSRAAVSRVVEAIEENSQLPANIKSLIEVNTYHAFFWEIIKTHGYLLGLPRKLEILVPPAEAIALLGIRRKYPSKNRATPAQKQQKEVEEQDEKIRLAMQDGKICFDLFAEYAAQILQRSRKIRELVSLSYPYIILDEFQDTNSAQWEVVKSLGQNSFLMALADPDQRIYDFIGADPERLDHFKQVFYPQEFDFKGENHRSNGTDIATFGNDILLRCVKNSYNNVIIEPYRPYPSMAFSKLKLQTVQATRRLIASGKTDWSLAVLVPTRKMVRQVSGEFNISRGPRSPKILHTSSIDMNGVVLAAEIIGFMLQGDSLLDNESELIDLICNFYQGKGGDTPSQKDIKEALSIRKAYDDRREKITAGKAPRAGNKVESTLEGYNAVLELVFSGDPASDWRVLRDTLEGSNCTRLKEIANEAKNLRLLNRGTQLRDSLSQNWRDTGGYNDALNLIQKAFVQEHFAMTHKPETGLIVMNMHKAKGKQFDEVIIFEGWPMNGTNPNRIIWGNSEKKIESCKQNFRVSVTRAKSRTTILTPDSDPCILLPR